MHAEGVLALTLPFKKLSQVAALKEILDVATQGRQQTLLPVVVLGLIDQWSQ